MPDPGPIYTIYRRSVRTSFFLVLFLVFVGGFVRSTGAGLGCPDWPKCFGLWIPPTHISEVPEIYWNDPLSSVDGQLIFNPIKTWTEYLNRLLGVVIGFSILIQFLAGLIYNRRSLAFLFSSLALVLVLFQGWLGAKVVSSDLKPIIISIHLVVALLIGFSLLSALFYTKTKQISFFPFRIGSYAKEVMWVTTGLLLIQFFLGTGVRSQVDELFRKYQFEFRELYLSQLDWVFIVHRSLSLAVLVFTFLQIVKLGKWLPVSEFYQMIYPFLLTIFLIITGVILAYLEFPALAQPFHLLVGFSIVCAQFWLILHIHFGFSPAHGSD